MLAQENFLPWIFLKIFDYSDHKNNPFCNNLTIFS